MKFPLILTISDTISSVWDRFSGAVMSLNSFKDILDIFLVTLMVYALIIQFRKSQSIQILKGVVLITVTYFIVNLFEMNASKFIFNSVLSNIILIFVILFSGELRQSLEKMGRSRIFPISALFSSKNGSNQTYDVINCVCRACAEMSEDKIGSLIIFQRKTLLGDITRQSVPIDSCVTTEMLLSIFFPKAALHDGAIVIKDNRIVSARCVVPLKNEKEVTEHVGTRHRAALEVSLHSDAVAVVTSEETGIISIAYNGQMKRGLTDAKLRQILIDLLIDSSENDRQKDDKKDGKKKKSKSKRGEK